MSGFLDALERAQKGDGRAASELLPLVYGELRCLAAAKLARESPGHTLQPTALVHEAWLRVTGGGDPGWNSRGHFISAAAEAMRRILIEAARRKQSLRRGNGRVREEVQEHHLILERPSEEILAVSEALDKFAAQDPLAAKLVELRYFVGMSLPEAAHALDISPRTADRLWAYARIWLKVQLESAD